VITAITEFTKVGGKGLAANCGPAVILARGNTDHGDNNEKVMVALHEEINLLTAKIIFKDRIFNYKN